MSRKEAIRAEIRRSIVLGVLNSGDSVTEASLAELLGASRPTVREALSLLTDEGLVSIEPYRGIQVSKLTLQQRTDIAVGRIALDRIAVEAFLQERPEELILELERDWDAYEQSAFDPDPVRRLDGHLDFHFALWRVSGNYLLEKAWATFAAQLTIAYLGNREWYSDTHVQHQFHLELMEALRTLDREKILQALEAHVMREAVMAWREISSSAQRASPALGPGPGSIPTEW